MANATESESKREIIEWQHHCHLNCGLLGFEIILCEN